MERCCLFSVTCAAAAIRPSPLGHMFVLLLLSPCKCPLFVMYFRQVEYDVISAIIMMKLPHSLDTTGGGITESWK